MRKFLMICCLLMLANLTFGSVNIVHPPIKATEVLIPIGKTGKSISLMELSRISLKDLEALTGRKMHLMDRMVFRAGQRKLSHSINADGSFSKKRFEKFFQKRAHGSPGSGSGVAGFVLGYFLFLVGVLIAYLINDDFKKNRVKWAWIGAAAVLALTLIAIAAWSSAWGG